MKLRLLFFAVGIFLASLSYSQNRLIKLPPLTNITHTKSTCTVKSKNFKISDTLFKAFYNEIEHFKQQTTVNTDGKIVDATYTFVFPVEQYNKILLFFERVQNR